MAVEQTRKWQLTINNPFEHGVSFENLIDTLNSIGGKNLYWCFCGEYGENETFHFHVYIFKTSAIRFSTLKNLFPTAHIEPAHGTNQENRSYILKDAEKHNCDEYGFYDFIDKKNVRHSGLVLRELFLENRECPEEYQGSSSGSRLIIEMIKAGSEDYEIVDQVPTAYKDLDKIQRIRSMYRDAIFKKIWRDLNVVYIFGKSGVGKSRSVMDKYGYENVFRVTNYKNPFDGYDGQDVVAFEEFRSSLKYDDMLKYLDGYPLLLPARFADKQACYTKVFIISNIPPNEQYFDVHGENIRAFWRRVHEIRHFVNTDFVLSYESYDKYMECER